MTNLSPSEAEGLARNALLSEGIDAGSFTADPRPPGSFSADGGEDAEEWTVFFDPPGDLPGGGPTVHVNDSSSATVVFLGR